MPFVYFDNYPYELVLNEFNYHYDVIAVEFTAMEMHSPSVDSF